MDWQASDIEPFFFEAVKQGYAFGAQPSTLPGLDGAQVIVYERDPFKLTDCWWVNHGRGFGYSVITAGRVSLWGMNYFGYYPKSALPTLMAALISEYGRDFVAGYDPKLFLGCRGPRVFQHGGLTYKNTPTQGGNFRQFSGFEEIVDGRAYPLGWHSYSGYMLLGPLSM